MPSGAATGNSNTSSSLRARAASNNTLPKTSSPLAQQSQNRRSSEIDNETLEDLNNQLESFRDREHLAFNNAYDDSRVGTPSSGSEVDLRLEKSTSPESSPSPPEVLSEKEVAVLEQEIKKSKKSSLKRYRFRNLSKQNQASILDMQSSRKSTFFGFYTLFWITVAVMILRTFSYNWIYHRQLLGTNVATILHRDLIKIALTDLWMYLSTYFVVGLQMLVKRGLITWRGSGWVIQNLWQTFFLFFFMWFAHVMDFPWIGSVFLLLHSLVLLMKQHSYGFYNGYMWGIRHEMMTAKELLTKLSSAETTPDETVAALKEQIDFCQEELDMQSSKTPFPTNITLQNYFTFSMFPTLVYQIEYPRTEKIRWTYVLEKAAATFGVMFLMLVVAENNLYPMAMKAMALRNRSFYGRLTEYPFVLMELVPPFILMYLLVFYIIWDAILNGIAELTRFGDREFYGEWWNSVTWDQFAKDWNTPVHRFLLRHVYHSSMSAFDVSKPVATLLTFLLSSCIHELVMLVIFKKLRGYLLFLQMCQLPLVAISRTKYLRDKELLGNIVFWIGIITGPSLMCSLYLTF